METYRAGVGRAARKAARSSPSSASAPVDFRGLGAEPRSNTRTARVSALLWNLNTFEQAPSCGPVDPCFGMPGSVTSVWRLTILLALLPQTNPRHFSVLLHQQRTLRSRCPIP